MEEESTKKKLQIQWNQCQEIEGGLNGKYSLNRSKLISRDKSGVTYRGIRRYESLKNQIKFQQVIIKEFYPNKKEKYLHPNEETLFSKVNPKSEFKLKTIDIFPGEKTDSYYLITESYQYSLQEKSKQNYEYFRKQEQLRQLCLNISEILNILHFEIKNQGIVHRNISPICIVKRRQSNGKSKYCLRDFSYAAICGNSSYVDEINQRNYCYQAPQIQKKTSREIDIWSFGCILYEVLSGTEKLIQNEEYYKYLPNESEQKKYIQSRIFRLKWKLEKYKDLNVDLWLDLIYRCLSFNQRTNAKAIHELISRNSKEKSLYKEEIKKKYDQQQVQRKIVQEKTFETIRLKILSDRIMTMFNQQLFSNLKLKRFQFYVILKFASSLFLKKYAKMKETIKSYFFNQYNQFKSNQGYQERNIIGIKQKSVTKIKKEIKQADKQSKLYYQAVINKYPQILAQYVSQTESRRILYEFCYDIKDQPNQSLFVSSVGQMLFYLRNIEDYPSLLSKNNESNSKQAPIDIKFMKLNRELKKCIKDNEAEWILQNARSRLDFIAKFNILRKKQNTEG